MGSSGRIIRRVGMVSVFVLWSACALNPPQATPTGYLADYSEFVPHPERLGALLYTKPGLDLRRYRRVIVDPVELALSPEAVGRRVNPEDLARLGRYLHDALVIALRNRYPVLEEPGAAVLRLRAAITDVVPTQPVLNTAETLLAARAVSTAHRVIRGTDLFVGQIAIETEVIDSETGDRLMALVDRPKGGGPLQREGRG